MSLRNGCVSRAGNVGNIKKDDFAMRRKKIWCIVKDWHDWFAWHPVFCDNRIAWMRKVERRISFHSRYPVGPGGFFITSYRKKDGVVR